MVACCVAGYHVQETCLVRFRLMAIILQVYLFMGIVIGSAVFPIYCCLTWKKTSALAAICGMFVSSAQQAVLTGLSISNTKVWGTFCGIVLYKAI